MWYYYSLIKTIKLLDKISDSYFTNLILNKAVKKINQSIKKYGEIKDISLNRSQKNILIHALIKHQLPIEIKVENYIIDDNYVSGNIYIIIEKDSAEISTKMKKINLIKQFIE